MKKLLSASMAITVGLLLCALDDFLSLHDIKADYVSKSVLHYLGVETSEPLPRWTEASLEWTSLTISFALRSVLIVANFAILLLLRNQVTHGGELAAISE